MPEGRDQQVLGRGEPLAERELGVAQAEKIGAHRSASKLHVGQNAGEQRPIGRDARDLEIAERPEQQIASL